MKQIVEIGDWQVREVELTWPKVMWLWEKIQKHGTLFSDLTRGDVGNFMNTLISNSTYWFEICRGEEIVGLIWLTEMYQVVDANVHCVMFDRRPAEKAPIMRELNKWLFANFPLNRLTAPVPAIYFATTNLLRKIGFIQEGMKREAVLIGGKWVDIFIYGITRSEVTKCLDLQAALSESAEPQRI